MAHAKKTKVQITKRVDAVQLTLTTGEVDFLLAVLGKVGGSESSSPRKYSETIRSALKKATGLDYPDTDAFPLSRGSIHFNEYSTPPKAKVAVRPDHFATSVASGAGNSNVFYPLYEQPRF